MWGGEESQRTLELILKCLASGRKPVAHILVPVVHLVADSGLVGPALPVAVERRLLDLHSGD